jgi:DNA-binding MarR family transcriptional regulator
MHMAGMATMPDDPAPDVIRAWTLLVRAKTRVLGAVEEALRQAGLPPLAWYDVLLELRRAGHCGLRPYELERRLLLAQPNVSRLLARLEAAGLVARHVCPEDRRGQMVVVTAAGRDLQERMWPVYRAAIEQHVGRKLESDRAATVLADHLERLLADP